MKHLADELDGRRLVWILFLEGHDESKSSIFKGSICRTDNDGIPNRFIIGIKSMNIRFSSGKLTKASHYLQQEMRKHQREDQFACAVDES